MSLAMQVCLLSGMLGVSALSGCGGGGGASAPTNQAPTAAAKISGEAVLNAATAFDTTGSADSDGTIATRAWAYGDGQTGSADTHVYTAVGTYTASYTVTDNSGATSSVNVPVTVLKCSAAGSQAALLSPYPTLCMQSTRGEMVLEVYPLKAPATVANFLKYVDDGFFAGTVFHRVIPGFVIQGGGFLTGMVAKTATYPPIALESNNGLQNWQYSIGMARTSVANSATSQFFVNLVANHSLDYSAALAAPDGYAVFGQVIAGMAVVEAIGAVATTTTAGFTDVPVQDVVIRSIVRLP
jgi:cyclophilin family peptidyl-prolyl cis-trans isomerase